MGFEICYKYHEKTDTGYNRDEVKILKKRVGDPFEDVSLERLAAAIMMQYARRDVFITDVEVYELTKNKISFRETKGGVVVKNKKFLFDGESSIVEQELVDAPQTQMQPFHSQVSIGGTSINQHQPSPVVSRPQANQPHHAQKPVKTVVFAPELQMMPEVKQKNLKFTPDKKYSVFQVMQSPTGIGEIFKMLDDTGREQLVSDKYFVPGEVKLIAGELGFNESPKQRDGGNLYWGGSDYEDMPDIRGRR